MANHNSKADRKHIHDYTVSDLPPRGSRGPNAFLKIQAHYVERYNTARQTALREYHVGKAGKPRSWRF